MTINPYGKYVQNKSKIMSTIINILQWVSIAKKQKQASSLIYCEKIGRRLVIELDIFLEDSVLL